jgi:hypothetical protein
MDDRQTAEFPTTSDRQATPLMARRLAMAFTCPMVEGRRRPPLWLHGTVLLLLLTANFVLYYRTTGLGFFSVDDPYYVQNNPSLDGFNQTGLVQILTQPYLANYAPATLLSYALDVAVAGGKSARAAHLSNLLWYAWCVLMVYLLVWTLRAELLTATLAAALFLLHPVHVEVVAWISSRKDLVATGFALLCTTCYLLYRRRSGRWWYVVSLGSFLLAAAAKQSVVVLPAVMLAWDALVERRTHWTMVADKVPFGLIGLVFGLMTWHAQPSSSQHPSAFVLVATLWTNLWLLTGLGQYVLFRPAPNPATWGAVTQACLILAALVVWIAPLGLRRGRNSHIKALAYWVLILMVPPMLLNFPVPITDRYLFLASAGVCIALAELAVKDWRTHDGPGIPTLAEPDAAARRQRPILPMALAVALGVIWAARTSSYLDEWCDPRSVWYAAHLKNPNTQVALFLGEAYQEAGNRIDAFIRGTGALDAPREIRLAQVMRVDPVTEARLVLEWSGRWPSRTNSLAWRDRLWSSAWEEFEEAVKHHGKLVTPNLYLDRGRLLVSQAKYPQAIAEFQIALRHAEACTYKPVRQEARIHVLRAIGVAYWHEQDYPQAVQWYLKAREVQRQSGSIWISTLDDELRRAQALAAAHAPAPKS